MIRETRTLHRRTALGQGLGATPLRCNDPALLMRIDAHFGKANTRFARRVWGEPWAAVVRDAGVREPTESAGKLIAPETEERRCRRLNVVDAGAAQRATGLARRGQRAS